jgi:glycerol-3-phosphate acyltransferase PlsX
VSAGIRCTREFSDVSIVFVGDKSLIHRCLSSCSQVTNIEIEHADEVVSMSDKPSVALRRKKGSSMHRAIELVRDGAADACVSTGNTGALMAVGRHILKTVQGIDRPAIIKAIPSATGRCYLLDLGANINCRAENLLQFAAMGSLMCQTVEGIASPRVGLLNIGEEELKGEDQVRIAASLLQAHDQINFIGYIEGDGIYQSDADVIVCDGWVGNVALKTSEGLAKYVSQMIRRAFDEDLTTRAAGVIADPVLQKLCRSLDPDRYNGASLLGLNGIVVKSHGSSTLEGFYQAIRESMKAVSQDLPGILRSRLQLTSAFR